MPCVSIGSMFNFDESTLGKTMLDAAKLYREVFGNLPSEKKLVLEQIGRLFTESQQAYSSLFKFNGDMRTDTQRVCQVAGHSQQYMIHFQNVRELLKTDDSRIHDTVDKTSEWLKKKGWFGLPMPSDEKGVKVFKTSKGVYNDMKSYNEAYGRMMFQLCGITEQGRRR